MSDTVFARDLIREAFPAERHGSVKSAQYAAYSYLRSFVAKQMTFRRVRSIWEGAARRIDNEEAVALRKARTEEARREYSDLKRRLESLETALALADAEAAGNAPDARWVSPRASRGMDRAGIGRG